MKKFSVFILILVSLFLISCADNDAHVTNITAITVFDFNDTESPAKVRLSVFAEALSPVNRGSFIAITNEQTGLSWKADTLHKAKGGTRSWTGYPCFAAPEGMNIPQGAYHFAYEDYAENSWESMFKVSYNESFLTLLSSEFPAKIKSSYLEKFVLFNEKGNLIYYGDKKDSWTDLNSAAKDYSAADVGRLCYYISSSNTMILMPPQKFERQPEREDDDD